MRISGGYRLAFIWLAVVATLMATLAPSIAQALSASSGSDWASVCSAADASDGGSSTTGTGQPGHLHTFEHCPYCAMHSDFAPPPPPQSLVANAPVAFAERPAAFLDAPRRSGVWSAAQPRAPPIAA